MDVGIATLPVGNWAQVEREMFIISVYVFDEVWLSPSRWCAGHMRGSACCGVGLVISYVGGCDVGENGPSPSTVDMSKQYGAPNIQR